MENVVIPIELSRSWPEILSGRIPAQVELFFIAWQDRSNDKYVAWSVCLSTSEPSPYPNCDARIIASTTVDVPRKEGGFEEAIRRGLHEFDEVVLKSNSPKAVEFRNKFSADTADGEGAKRGLKSVVEVVDPREFAELLQRARLGR